MFENFSLFHHHYVISQLFSALFLYIIRIYSGSFECIKHLTRGLRKLPSEVPLIQLESIYEFPEVNHIVPSFS